MAELDGPVPGVPPLVAPPALGRALRRGLGLRLPVGAPQERFFAAKRELARRDPALALALPWLSPLSRALLWLGGWRPCAAYRVAEAWAGLSAEAMRRETKAEEAAVERDMGRVQLGLLRMVAPGAGGDEAAVAAAMEPVAVAADAVRRVVAALGPHQVLAFLAQLIGMEIGFYAMEPD
ncbi:protein DOG1-like 4 [Ananas comosus]|uniref:Protein DOG1-like 4 n=1 Tax=Ananas comosus TaxID=4615 RepID=A0A6P5GA82_ANACO|nr:protein DOG1-like 4 [Ananas comosus]